MGEQHLSSCIQSHDCPVVWPLPSMIGAQPQHTQEILIPSKASAAAPTGLASCTDCSRSLMVTPNGEQGHLGEQGGGTQAQAGLSRRFFCAAKGAGGCPPAFRLDFSLPTASIGGV